MKCPYCGNAKTKVIDSRSAEDDSAIRRRRSCTGCGSRFTTFERRERTGIVVVKRNGTREPYDRDKLASGLFKACSKREVPESVIEENIGKIEEEVMKSPEKEISAADIGNMVMERLREIDEIAYVRFASVYKRFDDVSEFQKEIEIGGLTPEQVDRPVKSGRERSRK